MVKKNKETKKMKVGIYSPYLETLGGGERYILSIAQYLKSQKDYAVYIYGDVRVREKIESMLNIDLSGVNFLPQSQIIKTGPLSKIIRPRMYDIFFYMTDGSLFFPIAKKNFLIVQSPIHLTKKSLLNKVKLHNWEILCYSEFMAGMISDRLGLEATVLSPPVEIEKLQYDGGEKQNIILSVGRFFINPHNKKQELLIDVFRQNYKKYFSGWKLILAGGLLPSKKNNIEMNRLKETIGDFPIEFYTNVNFHELVRLYRKSKIYWHATGYREDLQLYPERAEHFGITTLEAMSAQCVPVVFKGGGQVDIINDGIDGYFWKSKKELLGKTTLLMNDENLRKKMSSESVKRAADFGPKKFYEKIDQILSE